ncbi:MAG TPA: CsbD family protein [Terriglobia bacterium]|nr:CsbD family protein [Terriglobia bacterium]
MKQSIKDRAKGRFHEVKGKMKEKLAKAAGDHKRESEGRNEKAAGVVQKEIGDSEGPHRPD